MSLSANENTEQIIAQLAGTVEYTDCFSAEDKTPTTNVLL